MSKRDAEIKAMLRNPRKMVEFQMRGKLPDVIEPRSPLITYLEGMTPRERLSKQNIVLNPELGYTGRIQFRNAEQMLRYLKPSRYMSSTWPAESRRIKHFNTEITDELLDKHCS